MLLVPALFRQVFRDLSVDRAAPKVLVFREQVPVRVERLADRRVTETPLNALRVEARRDQGRGVVVAEVVEPRPLGKAGLLDGLAFSRYLASFPGKWRMIIPLVQPGSD
ncbi:hypothetical protein MTP10_19510 [Nonomuraea sp. 3-1Str]|nr:hypothetical protein [Nonomuraea sp. 3-1Str]MDR8410911.1 hypothetical protein [Nonomuraea sp. 3-1Str]